MAYQVSGQPVYTTPATTSVIGSGSLSAYRLLHFGYTVLPLVAGLDKFFNLLTQWEKYLLPEIPQRVGMHAYTIMLGVGIIEILAAIITLIRPRIGGYIVALWLALIVVNLIIHPAHYYDIALRDLGLMFGAVALAALSRDFDTRRQVVVRREVVE